MLERSGSTGQSDVALRPTKESGSKQRRRRGASGRKRAAVPFEGVKILSVEPKTGETFRGSSGAGGVPHTMWLPHSGVRWDGRSTRTPGTTPKLRFAARDAGVVPDLLRHLGSFCTAGGQT